MIGRYRRDIDGLRTIAILPVLLFHAGVPGMTGGFVGVDVFFVISGFLITGIIASEVDERRFSILNFYERRIRRILPALAAVMLAVLAAAALLYFPNDFRLVPRSIVAALLFCSNILFYTESSYFLASAHTKPMLHTWSLAVEEQFYILFPLLLILLRRHAPLWRTPLLIAIFVGSLALSVVGTALKPDFAFYMLPTRAWEMMAGALLAVGAVPAVRNGVSREVIALAGIAAIGWAVVTFSDATPFPGAAALLPVLGAAALIHVAPGTLVGRILGLGPVVFVGLISYSLYLWHWPVIVFAEYATDTRLSGWLTVAAIVASFALAILSWRFVERPFRDKSFTRPRLFRAAAATAATICVLAGAAQASRGWPGRFSPEVLRLEASAKASSPKRGACHWDEGESPGDKPPCALGAAVTPTIALWGDSHGVELTYALGEIAARQGASIAEMTSSSCPPALGVELPGRRGCDAQNRAVLQYLIAHPKIATVILAGYWANPAVAANPALPAGLEETARSLREAGRRVVLVGAYPPNPFSVPRRLAHLAQVGRLGDAAGIPRAEIDRRMAYLAPVFARLRADGVIIVQPEDVLCATGICLIYRDGEPLYFDAHHLSVAGARLVATRVAGALFPSR